jgi:hypothetical protein
MSFTDAARLTLIVTPLALPAMAPHPTFTECEIAQMPASERVHFLDAPEAHIAAFQDAQRQMRFADAAERWEGLREQRTGSRARVWESDGYQANARLRAHEARG